MWGTHLTVIHQSVCTVNDRVHSSDMEAWAKRRGPHKRLQCSDVNQVPSIQHQPRFRKLYRLNAQPPTRVNFKLQSMDTNESEKQGEPQRGHELRNKNKVNKARISEHCETQAIMT